MLKNEWPTLYGPPDLQTELSWTRRCWATAADLGHARQPATLQDRVSHEIRICVPSESPSHTHSTLGCLAHIQGWASELLGPRTCHAAKPECQTQPFLNQITVLLYRYFTVLFYSNFRAAMCARLSCILSFRVHVKLPLSYSIVSRRAMLGRARHCHKSSVPLPDPNLCDHSTSTSAPDVEVLWSHRLEYFENNVVHN